MNPADIKRGTLVVFRPACAKALFVVWEAEAEPFQLMRAGKLCGRSYVSLHAFGAPHVITGAPTEDLLPAPTGAASTQAALLSMSLPYCTFAQCTNYDHDHTDRQGLPLMCADCGEPMHYDDGPREYLHDRPAAPDCALTGERTARR